MAYSASDRNGIPDNFHERVHVKYEYTKKKKKITNDQDNCSQHLRTKY